MVVVTVLPLRSTSECGGIHRLLLLYLLPESGELCGVLLQKAALSTRSCQTNSKEARVVRPYAAAATAAVSNDAVKLLGAAGVTTNQKGRWSIAAVQQSSRSDV